MPQVPHAIAVERIRLIPVMTPGANLGRVLVIIFRIFYKVRKSIENDKEIIM